MERGYAAEQEASLIGLPVSTAMTDTIRGMKYYRSEHNYCDGLQGHYQPGC